MTRQVARWSIVGCALLVALSTRGCSSKSSPGAVAGCTSVVNQIGADTGFESCADGTLRRRSAIQCPLPATSSAPACTPAACTSDSDCLQNTSAIFPQPFCADAHHLAGYCGCYDGCREDADCAPGSICECGVVLGQCVPAQCATNADCGAGFACVATPQGVAGGVCNQTSNAQDPPLTLFACQTAPDSCRGPTDCADAGTNDANEIEQPTCLYDGSRRACGLFCAYPP